MGQDNSKSGDTGNMMFQMRTIQLFPEDLEILKSLPEDQRADFMVKIRKEGRYIVVYDE